MGIRGEFLSSPKPRSPRPLVPEAGKGARPQAQGMRDLISNYRGERETKDMR